MVRRVFVSLGLAGSSSGCFAPPPTLSQPEQTPPFIVSSQVTPPISTVHRLSDSGVFDFNVPFRSEDAGEDVVAALYLDLTPGETNPANVLRAAVSAGTFDMQREISGRVSLSEQASTGCHSLTLLVTQEGNVTFESPLPLDLTRVGTVNWWLDVPDPERPTLLQDCPPQAGLTP